MLPVPRIFLADVLRGLEALEGLDAQLFLHLLGHAAIERHGALERHALHYEVAFLDVRVRLNLYAVDDAAQDFLLLLRVVPVEVLLELVEHLVHGLGRESVLLRALQHCLGVVQLVVHLSALVVQPVESLLHVLVLALVVLVARIQRVQLARQHAPRRLVVRYGLADALDVGLQLLDVGGVVQLLAQPLVEDLGVRRALHQLDDLLVDVRLAVLPRERAVGPEVLLAVLARVRIGGLAERSVLLDVLRRRHVGHHRAPADGTAQHAREKVHVGVGVGLRERPRVSGESLLRRLPRRHVDDGRVLSLVDVEILLRHRLVLVARALDELHATTPEGYEAGVHRVAQHVLDGARSEELVLAVPSHLLAVALGVQLAGDDVASLGGLGVHLEDEADHLGLGLVNLQVAVAFLVLDELVSEGGLPSVPFALAGLLLAPRRRLHDDVLAFHLRERRQEGNHHLAHLRLGVDAVLHAYEVRAVVLHELQGVERVGGVSSETAQLEHEDVIDAGAGFYRLQHLLEVRATRDALAGVSVVNVRAEHAHVVELRIALQLVELRVD